MKALLFPILFFVIKYVLADINPIVINGKYFVDSVTGDPFYIKGVDYQPGGSSEFTGKGDPLSDPEICARDIYLLQNLGVNTIRIYSINPDLNHDKCMTLLATAGIYILLDVNSPLQNQHLNRYEPWITYNEQYLEHVFKIMEHFSYYNNTLGYFAGNEIINDKKSAKVAPVYIKRLIQDMKKYSTNHLNRVIPVGYSAADDLDYRVSLASYLECADSNIGMDSTVDFYGVNSYQWCGEQTMKTSGYDKLVEAYTNYSKPVFFSEFGCNLVQPRTFGEVKSIYSDAMYKTFCGGLVYEFTQEVNDYGLVKESSDKSVTLLPDFNTLSLQYKNVQTPTRKDLNLDSNIVIANSKQKNFDSGIECKRRYQNIEIEGKIAKDVSANLIYKGVKFKKGHFTDLNADDLVVKHDIFDENGVKLNKEKLSITVINEMGAYVLSNETNKKENKKKSSANNASVYLSLLVGSLFLSLFLQF
ncbi:hypothetical protein TPHA_0A00410 [Tetrapisispora phaffii CBS 4417]|uniref:1,3-beta-glucanosyltransferase n=1 Tax=Tetrapisispora phaffii (strain ATCC 24235 / CBS 4417 / NBRC 1672 / NRRL Y-8282 / UCD 70-5) TaxID=1071381 RepID=G8BMJ8_TETPH|nr:hypothetical protein TPHA_0A00410 [Tetrapisispora phaffii CBS 4417]CCE61126.1 hypothetical protein TPHA_0A00410 [Tetrapisispora phaffii CBS 4417]